MRFNPPPGWPQPPEGFTPGPGWRPDPTWSPVPPDWELWVQDQSENQATGGQLPRYTDYRQGSASTAFGQPPTQSQHQSPPSGTSGMAIAAFVLGSLGVAILGIVLGIVALARISRTSQRGRGLAIAGIALGSAWLAIGIVLIASGVVSLNSTPAAAPLAPASSGAGSQTVGPFTLAAGDCFDNPTATPGQVQNLTSVVQTPCNQRHNAQIFATFNVSGSMLSYPGAAKLKTIASSGCDARVRSSLDKAKLTNSMLNSLSIRFLFPLESSWLAGRRTVSCIVYNPSPTLTSSLLKG